MLEVKREFEERKKEVENYFFFLDELIKNDAKLLIGRDDSPRRVKIGLTITMKSSGILLLYNLVESTVINLLALIHSTFSEENLCYEQLSEEIQKIWFEYYYKNLKEGNITEEHVIWHMKAIHDVWNGGKPLRLTFEEYTKYKNGSNFSGNLDARAIKKIFERYGVGPLTIKSDELFFVKENRNKLAHGEMSFSECTKDMVPEHYNKLKNGTIDYLEYLIVEVNSYITMKKYKKIRITSR